LGKYLIHKPHPNVDLDVDDQAVEVIDKKVTDEYNSIYGGNVVDRVAKDFVKVGILEKGGNPIHRFRTRRSC
jgi:hypothetical protein